ncbi:DUF4384 domain-containing protein [Chryseolinea sp. T2]|uniref:DUF4384 domain-containing protein n=1 Tax=Chryseolinea sp. T2 TaxID=3129255 RepID=UPI003076AE22
MEVLTKARVFSLAIALSVGVPSFAQSSGTGQNVQQTKAVQDVQGQWVISNDITPVQARERAIDQAKAEALRLAGVPEYVAESNLTYKTEKDLALKDIHESLTSIDVSGEISSFKVVREEKHKNEFGNLMYDVWIDATVVLHTSARDPGFTMSVNGIRDSYRSPEELVFDILPSKEGFLNIFIISDRESTHLFPNKIEKQEKFEGGKSYKFPRSRALDYEVSSQAGMEVNYVVLLYTKMEVPFLQEETPENILKFIANIDPSQKCLKTYSILIRNETKN